MADTENNDYLHTEVSGAINQHTPSYWRLALPALGVRYGATFFKDWSDSGTTRNKFFDAAAGLWMLGITSFFANRTRKDMMSMFSETIADELDKKPSDVTFLDLFKSHNNTVVAARNNWLKYTGIRSLVNGSFFLSFSKWRPFASWKALNETSAINLGMGLNSAYLTYEVLGRGRTFFEQLQSFVDSKLNQDNALGEEIKPIELIHLYERNALDNDPTNAFKGDVDAPMWKQSQIIFERMAELMNQTYQHRHTGNKANFTLPKFLYLLGHNLIQPKEVGRTLAFIEVVNRYGVDALKNMVKALDNGVDLHDELQQFPGALPMETTQESNKKYTDGLAARQNGHADYRLALAENGEKNFVTRLSDKASSPSRPLSISE